MKASYTISAEGHFIKGKTSMKRLEATKAELEEDGYEMVYGIPITIQGISGDEDFYEFVAVQCDFGRLK